MISKAFDAIKKYDVIIIHRHSNPDGDAMGSQIGLKRVLQVNFPDKRYMLSATTHAVFIYGRQRNGRR